MTQREQAFRAMQRGSLRGILDGGTSIYGIEISTMNEAELRIALGWSLSQNARLMERDQIGITKETKQ